MSIGRPKGGENKKYTPEFKLEVINFNNVNGPAETLRVYWLPTDYIIYKWKKYILKKVWKDYQLNDVEKQLKQIIL